MGIRSELLHESSEGDKRGAHVGAGGLGTGIRRLTDAGPTGGDVAGGAQFSLLTPMQELESDQHSSLVIKFSFLFLWFITYMYKPIHWEKMQKLGTEHETIRLWDHGDR